MKKRGIAGSRSAVWRFFDRRNISFKNFVRGGAKARRTGSRTPTLDEEQGMFDPARLVFIDETLTNTSTVRLGRRCLRGERLIGYAPCGIGKRLPSWPVCGITQRSALRARR